MRSDMCPIAPKLRSWISFFHRVASEGDAGKRSILAAFLRVRVASTPICEGKSARACREMYGADERTTAYFTLHTTVDVFHSRVWRRQLGKRLESNPQLAQKALAAGENAAKALWHALDGIEARRTAKVAA